MAKKKPIKSSPKKRPQTVSMDHARSDADAMHRKARKLGMPKSGSMMHPGMERNKP